MVRLIGLSVIAPFVLQSLATPVRRAQCASTLQTAEAVTTRLQAHYYDSGSGQYNGGSLWTDANTFEDIHNLMLGAGITTWDSLADNSYIGRQANANVNWNSVFNGAWDDALWIVLSLWKMADYKGAHGKDTSVFINNAAKIYDIVNGQWDNTCGGGVWWSSAHTYKNAITNELYLLVSASGYNRFGNATYLANAKKSWAWLEGSGMRNSQGLWNDGLDSSTCKNNGQTTWTYNQGVIASGLGALKVATGNTTLLTQAEITLDATISQLTSNNILKESCDNAASGGAVCNQDQQIFKGIWTKHLQYYLDNANDASRNSKYSGFLGSQTSAVFHYGTDADNDIGSVWYAPNAGGSVFTPKTSASGLAAHVAAAKYGPC